MTDTERKKLKDSLLKSSIPLEQIVGEMLSDVGYDVAGEFSYVRKNEMGNPIECSVDIWAFQLLETIPDEEWWGMSSLLVECKYCYPGVKWVFSRYPTDDAGTLGTICCMDMLTVVKIRDREPLYDFDRPIPFVRRGVAIHQGGFDPNGIAHGIEQLRYALPNRYVHALMSSLDFRESAEVTFECPILVTTADLRILQRGLTIEAVEAANDIEDITDSADAVVVHQRPGNQFRSYSSERLLRFMEDYAEAAQRIRDLDTILGYDKYGMPANTASKIDFLFSHGSTNILWCGSMHCRAYWAKSARRY